MELSPNNWIKINVDGSVRNEGASTGCGGIVKDETGKWVLEFGRNIGAANILEAEL